MKTRKHNPGFYDPPPMVQRYGGGTTIKNGSSRGNIDEAHPNCVFWNLSLFMYSHLSLNNQI